MIGIVNFMMQQVMAPVPLGIIEGVIHMEYVELVIEMENVK